MNRTSAQHRQTNHGARWSRQGRRWVVAASGVVALAGVLAACGEGSTTSALPASEGTAPVTTPAPTSSVVATPPTSPSTTGPAKLPTAERLTDASRLRLDGIGPIRVGMTPEQASVATGMNVHVTSIDFGNNCRYAEAENGPAGLAFMVFDGRIVRVDVNGDHGRSPIATLSGISMGSTEAEVLAAYPGRIEITPNTYQETGHDLVYKSSDPGLGLTFVTDGERVESFRSGQAGAVSAIEGCS